MINQKDTLLLFRSHLHNGDNIKCFFPHDFTAEKKKIKRNGFELSLILYQHDRIFQINFVSIQKLISMDKSQKINLYILL